MGSAPEAAPAPSRRMPSFVSRERVRQGAFLREHHCGDCGHEDHDYRLPPGKRLLNLNPGFADLAESYFREKGIVWHRHAAHGLSSQACCLNFLLPLAKRPEVLARLVQAAIGGTLPTMLPIEAGEPWHVGFEWIGEKSHLNEWRENGTATRGANATSADAAVLFERDGRREMLLIEWKYTEKYGAAPDKRRAAERTRRYESLMFAPGGPIRADAGVDLDDMLWEPLYQLLRQQMLACYMQAAGERGVSRVRVLHISPKANAALKRVTSPGLRGRGDDVFAVFRSLLVRPDDFIARSTESLFGPIVADVLAADPGDPWAGYLNRRYAFMADGGSEHGRE